MKRPPIFPFFTNMAESNQTHSASPPGQHPPCPAWHPDGFPASEHRHNRKKLVNDYSGGFVFTPPTLSTHNWCRRQSKIPGHGVGQCSNPPQLPHLVLCPITHPPSSRDTDLQDNFRHRPPVYVS